MSFIRSKSCIESLPNFSRASQFHRVIYYLTFWAFTRVSVAIVHFQLPKVEKSPVQNNIRGRALSCTRAAPRHLQNVFSYYPRAQERANHNLDRPPYTKPDQHQRHNRRISAKVARWPHHRHQRLGRLGMDARHRSVRSVALLHSDRQPSHKRHHAGLVLQAARQRHNQEHQHHEPLPRARVPIRGYWR